jgi:hypothetical protein
MDRGLRCELYIVVSRVMVLESPARPRPQLCWRQIFDFSFQASRLPGFHPKLLHRSQPRIEPEQVRHSIVPYHACI